MYSIVFLVCVGTHTSTYIHTHTIYSIYSFKHQLSRGAMITQGRWQIKRLLLLSASPSQHHPQLTQGESQLALSSRSLFVQVIQQPTEWVASCSHLKCLLFFFKEGNVLLHLHRGITAILQFHKKSS